eukprot:GEMP01008340.1.p1 GENE.GEMP01008340.1~~GEMP01008340.1.p1  ORF type:complete len:783 (+),score=118.34 GEMP01008340.1:464-2812(+)
MFRGTGSSKRKIHAWSNNPYTPSSDQRSLTTVPSRTDSFSPEPNRTRFPFAQRLVISPDGKFNHIWGCVMATLIMYTAIIFPYRTCFIDFRVTYPNPAQSDPNEVVSFWTIMDSLVDIVFIIDLILNFFMPFIDDAGETVTRPEDIWIRYIRGWFWLDATACIPAFVFAAIIGSAEGANKSTRLFRVHQIGRIMRLSRMIRLAMLLKAVRLMKFMSYNPFYRAFVALFGKSRIATVAKFMIALLLLVHLLGCGWYLVAYIENNMEDTWLYRRSSRNLLYPDVPPVDHWLASLYFVLTVFTSVGFGDIFPVTRAETVYVVILQLIGAVVQSMIVSEMINVLTWVDETKMQLNKRNFMVASFAQQAGLSKRQTCYLQKSLDRSISHEITGRTSFDRRWIQDLLLESVPRELQLEMVEWLFEGSLRRNEFFRTSARRTCDPKIYLLAGVHMTARQYSKDHIVYLWGSHAQFLFLVTSGIFAHVAIPSPHTGGHEFTIADTGLIPGGDPSGPSDADACYQFGSPSMHPSAIEACVKEDLAPYALCCFASYFGEWEMIYPTTRSSTVQAQTDGELILLPRAAFMMLVSEFPQFMDGFGHSATRRHKRIKSRMRSLIRKCTFHDLAASVIQASYRGNKVRRSVKKLFAVPLSAVKFIQTMRRKILASQSSCPSQSDWKDASDDTQTDRMLPFSIPPPSKRKDELEGHDEKGRSSDLAPDAPMDDRERILTAPNDAVLLAHIDRIYDENRKLRTDASKMHWKLDAMRKEQKEIMRMLHQMYFHSMTEKQ